VTILPAVEKQRSTLTDVAGILIYFLANLPILGYFE